MRPSGFRDGEQFAAAVRTLYHRIGADPERYFRNGIETPAVDELIPGTEPWGIALYVRHLARGTALRLDPAFMVGALNRHIVAAHALVRAAQAGPEAVDEWLAEHGKPQRGAAA